MEEERYALAAESAQEVVSSCVLSEERETQGCIEGETKREREIPEKESQRERERERERS